jgi:hypothetical protein
MSLVTLTTDFGLADGYVGIMHGVIRTICPGVQIVDLTHQVPPQAVSTAAYLLASAYAFFPPHAVHCVVVDPGVGTARRAVAVETPQGRFVAPDNGVLSHALARETPIRAVTLTDPRYHLSPVSHTFHGRDIFAPAAAHLAGGVPLEELGDPVADLIALPLPGVQYLSEKRLRGRMIHVDRFGNLITSIGRLRWEGEKLTLGPPAPTPVSFSAAKARVRIGDQILAGLRPTYGAAQPGELLALVGSAGHLEIAVAGGSAAERLGLGLGAEVILEIKGP